MKRNQIYIKYNHVSGGYNVIDSMVQVKQFCETNLGKRKYESVIQRESHDTIMTQLGYRLVTHTQLKELERKRSKDIPIRYGKYFICDLDTNEAILIDGKPMESEHSGTLVEWLSRECTAQFNLQPNILSDNGILDRNLCVRQRIHVVPEGQHTHYMSSRKIEKLKRVHRKGHLKMIDDDVDAPEDIESLMHQRASSHDEILS